MVRQSSSPFISTTLLLKFLLAADCARKAFPDRVKDNKDDACCIELLMTSVIPKFRSDLMRIAMATLSSKILSHDKERFAKLDVDAVMRLKGSTNLEVIQIIKKAGGYLRVHVWMRGRLLLIIILHFM
ncbi:putative T-complex protein 1, beta subunit [Helianthus anomalus]